MRSAHDDAGNAAVEFVWLAVLLMVPLIYLMLAVFDVQRASFGVTEAARQAGRAFVVDCGRSLAVARARAQAAAALALGDQGYPATPVQGMQRCPAPGASAPIVVSRTVQLPGAGAFLPADRAGITVTARFLAVRDEFAP